MSPDPRNEPRTPVIVRSVSLTGFHMGAQILIVKLY